MNQRKNCQVTLTVPFLAFELQSKQSGGLSRKLAKRIGQIESGEFQTTSPKLKPGGRLIREWNGVAHIVDVLTFCLDNYQTKTEKKGSKTNCLVNSHVVVICSKIKT